jgi:CxxC motif-containing protein/NADPH-dependent 2,4-dienoyl-CoA reductase/sulfur reductase-like enzyme
MSGGAKEMYAGIQGAGASQGAGVRQTEDGPGGAADGALSAGTPVRIRKDVVVIGGGPAGMAAAISLHKRGIEDIVLLEKENRLGGVLSQCIHDGFGLIYYRKNYSGPEYSAIYEQKIIENKVPYLTDATVLSVRALPPDSETPADGGRSLMTVQTPAGAVEYEASAVIAATGCRERGRGLAGIPGTRPAGIYTAGTAQAMINLQNLMPGRRAVIVGSGDIGLIMARRITLEGGQVLCVVEKEDIPGGLRRNIIQCLEDFDIPLFTNTTVTNVYGKERVFGVDVSRIDSEGRTVPESTRHYECDTLILSVGLIPEEDMIEDRHRGVFLCGNSLYVHDLVDDVTLEGEMAAGKVEDYLKEIASGKQPGETRYSWPGIETMRKKRAELLARKKDAARKKAEAGAKTITCIMCPNGCEITYDLTGGMCEKGPEYVKNEILNPKRTLTSSVRVAGGTIPLASVKTTGFIPKEKLRGAMKLIAALAVEAPVEPGQVIRKDFIEEGIDLVATKAVPAAAPAGDGGVMGESVPAAANTGGRETG